MFLHMVPVRREAYVARGETYELLLFRIEETGDLRLFVAKGSFGVGPTFAASDEVVRDAMIQSGMDIADVLMSQARDDVLRNEFGHY